jgi:hypothetical protein
MTVLHARIRQTTVCRPMYGEALCVIYMPVKDIEIVLMEHGQQIEDGLNGKELPTRVQHEASMRIKIGLHIEWIYDGTKLYSWRDERAGL